VPTTTSPQAALTPVIEPHTLRWLGGLAAATAGSPPLWELSPEDARQFRRYVQAIEAIRWFWDSYLPNGRGAPRSPPHRCRPPATCAAS
jgi:hypothetical protein